MKQAGYLRGSLLRFLGRLLLLILLIATAVGFYLWGVGLPGWLVNELMARVPTGRYVLSADGISLDAGGGIRMRNVKLYRKRVVGPPALTAAAVSLIVDPYGGLTRGQWIRKVRIVDADFLPLTLVRMPSGESEPLPETRYEPVAVEVENCRMHGVVLERVRFDMAEDGPVVVLMDIKGRLNTEGCQGDFEGSVWYDARSNRIGGQCRTALNPHALVPLLHFYGMEKLVELINCFQFTPIHPPIADLKFDRRCEPDGPLSLEGTFRIEEGSYNSVNLRETSGRLAVRSQGGQVSVRVERLLILRPEGTAEAGFTVFLPEGRVEFEGSSKLEPHALLRLIGLSTNILNNLSFNGPVGITARGKANYLRIGDTDFRAAVQCYELGIAGISAENCSFEMAMIGVTNTLSGITASMCGGRFEGKLTLVVPEDATTNTQFALEGELHDAEFEQVLSALGTERSAEYRGKFWARFRLEGAWDVAWKRTVAGKGRVSVKRGRVFMLPLFGGLSRILTRIIPGLEFVLRQTDAEATFIIQEGVAYADKLAIEGDVLSLEGKGFYGLADHTLDLQIQVKLMKEHTLVGTLLRAITYPLSKIFEFRLCGTLEEPVWYPINFSTDLLRRIGLLERERSSEPRKQVEPKDALLPQDEFRMVSPAGEP
ncbi:MAG: hypothetical protein ACUVWX_05790 [Kiritimatiellia bacterium]